VVAVPKTQNHNTIRGVLYQFKQNNNEIEIKLSKEIVSCIFSVNK